MTLIAIELPELIITLGNLREKNIGADLIAILIGYEFIAYTITFLMLYELWAVHKSILKIGGLKQKIQSLLNSLILSLTSLGAGNIILILNEKTRLLQHRSIRKAHELASCTTGSAIMMPLDWSPC